MNNFKTLFLAAAFSSFIGFAQDYDTQYQEDSSSLASPTVQNLRKDHVITPSASPVVQSGADLFVSADFIYWTAREAGLNFGTLTYVPNNTQAVDNQRYTPTQSLSVDNKYSPGFQVGLGMIMNHDGWDMLLNYTWFRTTPKSKVYTGSFDTSVTPFLGETFKFYKRLPITTFVGNSATVCSDWRYRFNNFDLELGRNFFVSHYLTLRPHFGLKGGWQRQYYNIYWNISDIVELGTYTNIDYNTRLKQKMWNVGLRTGLDSSWMLTKNFSFIGEAAVSGVWTQFTVSHIDTATTSGSSVANENASNFQTYNQKSQFYSITPVLELLLGLRFDWLFSNDDYRIRLQAGWENQVWFNQNNFSAVCESVTSSNTKSNQLTMQGLTAELRFDF